MNIFETMIFGFYFAIGVICAWSLFQLILFILKELYVKYINKKFYGKVAEIYGKPKGMEFGKND